jgi:hypothetical protein
MKRIIKLLKLFASDLEKYNQFVEKDIIGLLQNKRAYYLLEYDYK